MKEREIEMTSASRCRTAKVLQKKDSPRCRPAEIARAKAAIQRMVLSLNE